MLKEKLEGKLIELINEYNGSLKTNFFHACEIATLIKRFIYVAFKHGFTVIVISEAGYIISYEIIDKP